MLRRLFDLVAVASLALGVAVVTTYFRSWRDDRLSVRTASGDYYAVNVDPGTLDLEWSNRKVVPARWSVEHDVSSTQRFSLPPATVWNRLGFWGGFTGAATLPDGTYVSFDQLLVPPWAAAVPFAVLPAVTVWRFRRRRRSVAGLCGRCGYDLRATPGRCPECGAASADTPPV